MDILIFSALIRLTLVVPTSLNDLFDISDVKILVIVGFTNLCLNTRYQMQIYAQTLHS